MKRIVAVLLAAGFIAAGAMVATADNGPESVQFETKMGAVSFPHQAHQGFVADCATCHHTGMDTPACRSCHGVDKAAPKAKDAFHKACKGCHQEQSGPTGCKDCHKK